jgi:hypothetical protein
MLDGFSCSLGKPQMEALVAIYVITYRRPRLLERALRSLIEQTEARWICRVVNDDPCDGRVSRIIEDTGDSRIELFRPTEHRGGAANFNLAFRENECRFASILEDDNWWEPTFLAEMLNALRLNPGVELAVGNEKVWREQTDGQWIGTGATVWVETEGTSEWTSPFEFACGSAKLCNSSMLFRTANSGSWQTPDDIPVDVTEHFRERCVPQPILLVHKPLVNYAETLATHRSVKGTTWSDYQCLLIGSCFHSLPRDFRTEQAMAIWRQIGLKPSPRATTLLTAAIAIPEARSLWATASIFQRLRLVATTLRRFVSCVSTIAARRRLSAHWRFLCDSTYNRRISETSRSNHGDQTEPALCGLRQLGKAGSESMPRTTR